MADQIPAFTLSPQDAAWGRWVQNELVELKRGKSRSDLDQIATNKGQGASVQALSEQVGDLRGRVGYAADGTGTSQTWTTPQLTPYTWGPALTFSLSEPRVVSIQSLISGSVYALATSASSSAFAFLQSAIFVDSGLASGARGQIGTNVGVLPNTGRSSMYEGVLVSRSILTLAAGTHVVQGGFVSRNAEVIGGAGAANVSASNPNIFVDILQPLGA